MKNKSKKILWTVVFSTLIGASGYVYAGGCNSPWCWIDSSCDQCQISV